MKYLNKMISRFACIVVILLAFTELKAEQPVLNGLLIEGSSYTGKSTICHLLAQRLATQHPIIKRNHLFLGESVLSQFLLKQAKNSLLIFESSPLYLAAVLTDFNFFKPSSDVFYLQDRFWLSMLYNNEFFLQDQQLDIFIMEKHFAFKWNVLLTVNPEVKQQRFLQRNKRSIFNQYFFDHPEIQEQVDVFMQKNIPKNENWLMIDTSYLTPEKIVEKILDYMQEAKY